jgi:hypothetical protein
MNLILITSIIRVSNNPLSYIGYRSVHNSSERYEDTKKTIDTIKKYITNGKIFLIECSMLNKDEDDYFKTNVDYYLNLWPREKFIHMTSSLSKSMGEGIMTIEAIKYLNENNIKYDNLYKISGRYWLNDNFNYDLYDNNKICIHRIHNNYDNVFTCFYKLPKIIVDKWYHFLLQSANDFENCVAYEIIFGKFINSLTDTKIEIKTVGINGYVSVSKDFIDM